MGLAGAAAVRAACQFFVGLELSGALGVRGRLDQLPTLVSFEPFDFSSKQFLQSHTRSGPTSTNLLAADFLHAEHLFCRCLVRIRGLDLYMTSSLSLQNQLKERLLFVFGTEKFRLWFDCNRLFLNCFKLVWLQPLSHPVDLGARIKPDVAGLEFPVVVCTDSVPYRIALAKNAPAIRESRIDIFPSEIKIFAGFSSQKSSQTFNVVFNETIHNRNLSMLFRISYEWLTKNRMNVDSIYPSAILIFLNPETNWYFGNPALRSSTYLVSADRAVAKENPLMTARFFILNPTELIWAKPIHPTFKVPTAHMWIS
jgi:hypothetical protein